MTEVESIAVVETGFEAASGFRWVLSAPFTEPGGLAPRRLLLSSESREILTEVERRLS